MNLKELYQEIILDHGKNPRNLRKTDNYNKDAKGHNPLCGDNVHIYLKLNENKKVEDISFEGSGCAISMASASIMTDLVKGKEEKEVKEIVLDFLDMIKKKEGLENKILNIKICSKTRGAPAVPLAPNNNKVKFIFYSIYRVLQYNRTPALAQMFDMDVGIPLTAANVHPVLDRVRSALLPVPG